MDSLLYSAASTFAAWDLGSFLKNLTSSVQGWGGLFIILVGVVMIIVSVFKAGKALIMHGKQGGQESWAVIIILLILGGALTVGGWSFVSGIAEGGKKTIDDIGNGSGGAGAIVVVDQTAGACDKGVLCLP